MNRIKKSVWNWFHEPLELLHSIIKFKIFIISALIPFFANRDVCDYWWAGWTWFKIDANSENSEYIKLPYYALGVN